jgi:GntR family transcriptional regulator, transcriptional repressor for pyruvate dehydrogenase complex
MTSENAVHLTDRVKLDLSRLIEADGLKPGDKLPPVDRLCERFSVSRTVVREAIGASMFMAAPQDINDVLDLMEFRIALEVEAAGLAAERRTEYHLLRMEQAMAQFLRHIADKSLATDADRSFHRAIADATNNNRFRLFVDEMGDRLIPRRALGASFVDENARAEFLASIQSEHQRIFAAISERKADEARLAMRQHLEDGRRRYREWRILNDTLAG